MSPKIHSNEKRHYHRIGYQSDATLSNSDGSWPIQMIDLSLKGCLIRIPSEPNLRMGESFTIQIKLSESVAITMQTNLAHQTSGCAGFRCEHIDLDSISRLRRLVELNLGDSSLLERDLESLSTADK